MSIESVGENVACARYHGTLPLPMCVLRCRLGHITGCQRCRQGEERLKTHAPPAKLNKQVKVITACIAADFPPPEVSVFG